MKKNILKGGAALLASSLLFAACGKDDDDNTPSNSEKIIGVWSQTATADDDNGNGNLDATERTALSTGDYNYLTFYNNGIVKDSSKDGSVTNVISIPYAVSGDGRYVTVTFLGITGAQEITQLDGSNLILRDTAESPTYWDIFVKK